GLLELEQLDLEMRIRSFEHESDVLRLHVRHAHVAGGNAAVDRRDVILSETKEREELDRRAGVGHCDRNMIRIEYHPCHSWTKPLDENLLLRLSGGGGGHVFRTEFSNPRAPHSDERPRCQLVDRFPRLFDSRKSIPPDR